MAEQLLTAAGGTITDDWIAVADDSPTLPGGKLLVSLALWQTRAEEVRASASAIGVRLPNTVDVETLADDIAQWDHIALEFPKFTDGRAYSQARLLRERCGFRGELRATGEVLRDQLFYMRRCGFDLFKLNSGQRPDQLAQGFADFSVAYQPIPAPPSGPKTPA